MSLFWIDGCFSKFHTDNITYFKYIIYKADCQEEYWVFGYRRLVRVCLNQDLRDCILTGVFTEASRSFFWSLDLIGFVNLELCVLRESEF